MKARTYPGVLPLSEKRGNLDWPTAMSCVSRTVTSATDGGACSSAHAGRDRRRAGSAFWRVSRAAARATM